LNLGLAHGMPGMLALLAIAELEGRSTPGGLDVVRWNAGWLVDNLVTDCYGPNLAAMLREGEPAPSPYPRSAWCYGAAGVGQTLVLAGRAVADRQLIEVGLELLAGSRRRLISQLEQAVPGFCHGVSGVLYLLVSAGATQPGPDLRDGDVTLLAHLLGAYDDDLPFGYSVPASDNPARDPHHPGLLTGVAGVALALLKAATRRSLPSDRLFLTA
jgi:hypothetical protein